MKCSRANIWICFIQRYVNFIESDQFFYSIELIIYEDDTKQSVVLNAWIVKWTENRKKKNKQHQKQS